LNEQGLTKLKEIGKALRIDVLEMTTRYAGHPSSCFSSVEIVTALFFAGVLRYRPAEPLWPSRDRFILSKGHAAPLLYAALARAGYFSLERLADFRCIGSGLHGHPVQNTVPGVEVTSGSLGQGLSFGLGHALAGRLSGLEYRVYVLLGDGECEEGQVWEAAMASSHYRAGNLISIVDYNKCQQTGPIAREMALEPLAEKWRSFGWDVHEADGHDLGQLVKSLESAAEAKEKPSVVIAHTVKGKGVSHIENVVESHGKPLTPDQKRQAVEEIRCS